MNNQLMAVIVDSETIMFDGRSLVGKDEVASALEAALERDPNFILVIGSTPSAYYKGIGTLIYASGRVGLRDENIRWTADNGDVVTFEELNARSARPST